MKEFCNAMFVLKRFKTYDPKFYGLNDIDSCYEVSLYFSCSKMDSRSQVFANIWGVFSKCSQNESLWDSKKI